MSPDKVRGGKLSVHTLYHGSARAEVHASTGRAGNVLQDIETLTTTKLTPKHMTPKLDNKTMPTKQQNDGQQNYDNKIERAASAP